VLGLLGLLPRCRSQSWRRPSPFNGHPLKKATLSGASNGCALQRPFIRTNRRVGAAPEAIPPAARAGPGLGLERRSSDKPRLLDLGFLENHVLARNRIVFAEADLVGRGAGVLLGDVEEPGASRAEQLDLLNGWFRHGPPVLIGNFEWAAL